MMIVTKCRPFSFLSPACLVSLTIRLVVLFMLSGLSKSKSMEEVEDISHYHNEKTTTTTADATRTAVIAPDVEKPLISLGTGGGMYGNRSVVEKAVLSWLHEDVGGRGIDTAIDYNNDDLVGIAWTKSGIPREEIFITTKQPGPIGYQETITALEESLIRLQTSYVDLYLIHFPNPDNNPHHKSAKELRQETWKGMEEVLRRGWTRSIGVSNYGISDLRDTLEVAAVSPAVNQVLWNPVTHDDTLLDFCSSEGITLEAWSPLGGSKSRHGEVLNLPIMKHIAASHNNATTTAQVALRWTLQHGMTLAIGTDNTDHMKNDLDVFGFRLTDAEVATISSIQNSTIATKAFS